jgi:4-amino-4-deoxy-L-arabinose transferase-like glycosyltransferase
LPAAVPVRKRTKSGKLHRFARSPRLPLLCILAVQAALSLRLAWSNTAFMDEALYLWAGHLEIAHLLYGSVIPAFPTYFSGAPVIYPVLGAIADAYGGLELARLLSLAFMLGSTALLYSVTGRLFGRRAAVGAAAVFAVLGPVQVLGAFATFDALSVFLLALAAWLVIQAERPSGELLLVAGGLVMALADAAKYASALWNPVIIALAALTAGQRGVLRPAMRAARLTGYVLGALALALFRFGGPAYVHGVLFTTLLRQAGGTSASALAIVQDSFNWVGVVFVLAAIGLGISFTEDIRTRLLCGTLTAAILLAPAEQARIHIVTSLHKHVAFGAWFAAIVAGYALGRAAETNKVRGWRVTAAATGIAAFLGIPQATSLYSGWPNSAEMVRDLAPVISQARCPCLVTENNVVNYYLLDSTLTDKFTGAFSFYYWDGALRRVLHGLPAYRQAIAGHYFRVVEVDPDENPAIYAPVTRALAATRGWRLVGRMPSGISREPFEIWRYNPVRSGSGPLP